MTRRKFLCTAATAVPTAAQSRAAASRPNVVVVMVDDMGFSDVGCYGGEIPTPNIDRLASGGLRFTQFYNTGRCCPTRASLLTGLFPHQTGVGRMTETPAPDGEKQADYGVDGYQGYLNRHCVTMAEVLRESGYQTYMSGKWHLGYHAEDRWPTARGFDRFYGTHAGASSYFDPQPPRGLHLDDQPVQPEGEGYYTTDAYTDYALRFLAGRNREKPFFLYLAYNAPHWPLHAKQAHIERFVGKYRTGWDALRASRRKRMIELGIIREEWGLSPRDPGARAWRELTPQQQGQLDYRMAVYAAQIVSVDENVGRLVEQLEREGELDNTLLLFLSDNGGCAEPWTDLGGQDFSKINDPAVSGNVSYGQGWANASNTPFRKFKVFAHEGGIATPLIAHWPRVIADQAGELSHSPGYLVDLMPTVLEATGAVYPGKYHGGRRIHPLEGRSLGPAFRTGKVAQQEWMFWEHVGHCAVRRGKWKALQDLGETEGRWELYDLETDRCEVNNLAAGRPDVVRELADAWFAWAWRVRVFPKGERA